MKRVVPSEDGEEEARREEAILLALYPGLRRFAAVVAPRELAPDDVVHDALVSVLRAGPISRLTDPAAYLRRAILSVSSNHRRRLGRGRRAFERLAGGHTGSASDHYPSDLGDLAALRPAERAVLYLQHVEGHDLATIAGLLQVRPDNARQMAVRARRRLRQRLDEEMGQ